MKRYYSINPATGKVSGVIGYDYDDNSITIQFNNYKIYNYSYSSCGSFHVENMKKLADAQSGLNRYVKKHDPKYIWKR